MNTTTEKKIGSISRLYEVLDELKKEFADTAIAVDRKGEYPSENIAKIFDSGLANVCMPEEQGGLNIGPRGNYVAYFDILDRIASGCSNTAQLLAVHNAAVSTIKVMGTPAQIDKFYGEVRDKHATFSYLGSEPMERFTADGKRAELDSVGIRTADGWKINAKKAFATGSIGAAYAMVFCMADGIQDPSKLLVAIVPTADPAVKVIDSWDNMGQRATASGLFEASNCVIPHDHILGDPGAFIETKVIGPLFQLTFASIFVGMAQGALDFAIGYSKNHLRPTVGYDRAVDEPTIQGHVGHMSTDIEAGRALVRRAATLMQEFEAGNADIFDAMNAVYQAKTFATRISLEITSRIFQVCGARATSSSFDADRFWRNARTLTLHDNLDKQHGVIGRYVLGVATPGLGTR